MGLRQRKENSGAMKMNLGGYTGPVIQSTRYLPTLVKARKVAYGRFVGTGGGWFREGRSEKKVHNLSLPPRAMPRPRARDMKRL